MSGALPTECTRRSRAATSAEQHDADRRRRPPRSRVRHDTPPRAGAGGGRASLCSRRASGGDRRRSARDVRPRAAATLRPFHGAGAERVADAVPLHASPERDARDAERRGGALAVPAVLLEHAEDAGPLVEQEPPSRRRRVRAAARPASRPSALARIEQRLERVLELAHVARPGVLEERPQRAPAGGTRSACRARRLKRATKCSTSSGRSSRRSRSGGSWIGEHAQPVVEVAPERAAPRPCAQRSRLTAATTRTSTRRSALPPSGRTSRSWTTRRSFAWSDERQVLDLVEEERAAVGELEHAGPLLRARR